MITVAIVGAGGYSGAELVSILLDHPQARVRGLFGSSARDGPSRRMEDVDPRLRGRIDLEVQPASVAELLALGVDAIFLATPHEASLDLAAGLCGEGGPVVFDLSGAFRLGLDDYPLHYGFTHSRPRLLERAVYGLPELRRAAIADAPLIAVPGCYPTSAILPLAPLARAGAISARTRPIIDSTSGVSGAGRAGGARTQFCEVSLQPYNVLNHRHAPEIARHAGLAGVVFTPHIAPFERGILSTIHAELSEGWTGGRVAALLHETYATELFVRLLPAGTWPSVAGVRHTNFCDIALAAQDSHLVMVSAIDNLVKGAAGQAVQCMNIRFGLPEAAGLGGKER